MENYVANVGRGLIPFPGAEALAPLLPLQMSPLAGGRVQDDVANLIPANVAEQASNIVSQAASVLREEMARSVFTSRQADPSSRAVAQDSGNPLRQVYDFLDQLAAAWPSLQGYRPGSTQPEASHADPLAELRSPGVKPGQRARISMTVCNYEGRQVWLVPAATDLLGSRDGRIACSLLEFAPKEFALEPQEKKDVTIALTVPPETAPGCYSGLFVVRGVDYLRALITIEVI